MAIQNKEFGKLIRDFRIDKGFSAKKLARRVGVDPTYLSRIENGHLLPSWQLFDAMIDAFKLDMGQIATLLQLRSRIVQPKPVRNETEQLLPPPGKQDKTDKQAIMKGDPMVNEQLGQQVQVNIPQDTKIFYSDSVFVSINPHGVVLDFAQMMPMSNQQQVVARIGMSQSHAKAFLQLLKRNLEHSSAAQ